MSLIDGLTVFHGGISIVLIGFVLIQFGKGAEAGLFSGGGDTGAIFSSSQKGNILTKITTFLAIIFLGLSVGLAVMRSKVATDSILDDTDTPVNIRLNSDEQKINNIPKEETTTDPTTGQPVK